MEKGTLEEVATKLFTREQLCAILVVMYVLCPPDDAWALFRVAGIRLHQGRARSPVWLADHTLRTLPLAMSADCALAHDEGLGNSARSVGEIPHAGCTARERIRNIALRMKVSG